MIMMDDGTTLELDRAGTWPVTPARVVKDAHTQLYEQHARPGSPLTGFYKTFIDVEAEKARAVPEAAFRLSFMFHPVHPEDPERGMKLASHIRAGLRDARTYQITSEMSDAIGGLYKQTRDKVNHIEASDMVSPSGFAWFDRPWVHTDMRGKLIALRAVSWAPATVHWEDGQVTDGTRVCHWTWKDDADEYRAADTDNFAISGLYRDIGDLILLHVYTMPHGVRFQTGNKPLAASKDDSLTTYEIQRINDADDTQAWLHAMWMLLDAEITVSTRAPIDRAARRRAQRASLRHDGVQVITLRRARHAEHGDDYEPVAIDWSCRWIVQGHWRHLEGYAQQHHRFVPAHYRSSDDGKAVCLTCFGRGAWVHPYVKGPDNKPMRHIEQVYRLSR